MDLKEFIFILLIIAVTCVFSSYFTYKILNTKIELLINDIEELKNHPRDNLSREEFRNVHNKINEKYNNELTGNYNISNVNINNKNAISENINETQYKYGQNIEEELCNRNAGNTQDLCDDNSVLEDSSDISSVTKTQNEVDILKRELEKIETLIDDSGSEDISENISEDNRENMSNDIDNSVENSSNKENVINEDDNEEIDNDVVELVNKLDTDNQYSNNNMSEFDELANIENDQNSELNDLIRVDPDTLYNGNKLYKNDIKSNDEIVSTSSYGSKSINSYLSRDNINKGEYENIAKQFIKNDLKDICKQINLPQKGNKIQLIEKIFHAGRQDLIMSKINA
jgi:hypothetical protein